MKIHFYLLLKMKKFNFIYYNYSNSKNLMELSKLEDTKEYEILTKINP